MAANEECPCCKQLFGSMEEMARDALTCGHVFHAECIEEYCSHKQQDITSVPCQLCSFTADDVVKMKASQQLETLGGSSSSAAPMVVEDDDDSSTDVSAATLGRPEEEPAPFQEPFPEQESAPEQEPSPEQALPASALQLALARVQVIIIFFLPHSCKSYSNCALVFVVTRVEFLILLSGGIAESLYHE